MKNRLILSGITALVLAVSACGDNGEDKKTEQTQKSLDGYTECISKIQNDKFGSVYNADNATKLKEYNFTCKDAKILANDIVNDNNIPFFMSGSYIIDFIGNVKSIDDKITSEKILETAREYSTIKNTDGQIVFMGGHYLSIFVWAGGTVEKVGEFLDNYENKGKIVWADGKIDDANRFIKEFGDAGKISYGAREMILGLKSS